MEEEIKLSNDILENYFKVLIMRNKIEYFENELVEEEKRLWEKVYQETNLVGTPIKLRYKEELNKLFCIIKKNYQDNKIND